MELLNIGCGGNYHPSWTNIDIVSTSPHVVAHDITKGLPYRGGTFDVVYHSHVIEHLTHDEAISLLNECVRVLKPGGTLRIATPDLENLARTYLESLKAALAGDPHARADHHWMELELFDQMVRNKPGGEMGSYLKRPDLVNKEFILSRIGQEAQQFCERTDSITQPSFLGKISLPRLLQLTKRAWHELISMMLFLLTGKKGRDAFREGLFRSSGEIHRWLYDRLSLAMLLEQTHLVDIQQCSAEESRIPDFGSHQLDVVEGIVRKPDSLFMEGTKPR